MIKRSQAAFTPTTYNMPRHVKGFLCFLTLFNCPFYSTSEKWIENRVTHIQGMGVDQSPDLKLYMPCPYSGCLIPISRIGFIGGIFEGSAGRIVAWPYLCSEHFSYGPHWGPVWQYLFPPLYTIPLHSHKGANGAVKLHRC